LIFHCFSGIIIQYTYNWIYFSRIILQLYLRICQEVIKSILKRSFREVGMSDWTFITNHGLILATIAKQPDLTAREVGDTIGVTERTAHRIIIDLEEAGYVSKRKVGRQNKYKIHTSVPLRDEMGDAEVGELLVMLGWKRGKQRP
jgi:hypothetical protein